MDAIIGRYRAHIQDDGRLVLIHPTGIAFDLTAEETVGLFDFINPYRKTLLTLLRETDTELKRIPKAGQEQGNKEPSIENGKENNP
jgi:hypothetical protein